MTHNNTEPIVITSFPDWELGGFTSEREGIARIQQTIDNKPGLKSNDRDYQNVYYSDGSSGRATVTTSYMEPQLDFDPDHLMDTSWYYQIAGVSYNGVPASKTVVKRHEWLAIINTGA